MEAAHHPAADPTFVAADDFSITLGAGNDSITGDFWAGGFFDTNTGGLVPYQAVSQDFWILVYEDGSGAPGGTPDLPFPGDPIASRLTSECPIRSIPSITEPSRVSVEARAPNVASFGAARTAAFPVPLCFLPRTVPCFWVIPSARPMSGIGPAPVSRSPRIPGHAS